MDKETMLARNPERVTLLQDAMGIKVYNLKPKDAIFWLEQFEQDGVTDIYFVETEKCTS